MVVCRFTVSEKNMLIWRASAEVIIGQAAAMRPSLAEATRKELFVAIGSVQGLINISAGNAES